MDAESVQSELIEFFKLLSDANRLKMIGLLAQQPRTVEELAAALKLRPSLAAHHLDKLIEAGLARAQDETRYALCTDVLHEKSKRLLAREAVLPAAALESEDAFERKVLSVYLESDGRLKEIPCQQKKRDVILRYILNQFRFGERYSEKQVNELIGRFHEDTATLRRALVDYGWLKRASGIYWRVE